MPFVWFPSYRRDRDLKREERTERIAALPLAFHESLSDADKSILNSSVAQTVDNVRSRLWTPTQVLTAYGKKALQVHEQTNCITEILIPSASSWALAAEAAINDDANALSTQPLVGIPISLKDSISVEGYDQAIGYTSLTKNPSPRSSPLVRLLLAAGALPFVKSSVPTTLLSFESSSALLGITSNPHNAHFTPGGSSGGEAALLAAGGSRVGFGTDVAGSVRLPAHWSGVCAVRGSVGRFPRYGNGTSLPGQEGVPSIVAPMARTVNDLEYVWRAVVAMKPWDYDHSCLEMSWREVVLPKKVKFGVMWDDGVVPPSPACLRALKMVVKELELAGHDIVNFSPPSPLEGLKIGSQLLFADGGKTMHTPLQPFEPTDPGMDQAAFYLRLPSIFKSLYIFYVRYIRRDHLYATLLDGFAEKSVSEYWALIARRESYRAIWADAWKASGVDFVLTMPNALPAVRHGGMSKGWRVCGYTFLFNIIDYTAGVLPITHVSSSIDALPPVGSVNHPYNLSPHIPQNAIAEGAYSLYDADVMHGLPVGIQIVGNRLQEERVIEGMKLVEQVMTGAGKAYVPLHI